MDWEILCDKCEFSGNVSIENEGTKATDPAIEFCPACGQKLEDLS